MTASSPEHICCPDVDLERWDGKTHIWKDKLFLQDNTIQFMHIPLNMGRVVTRMMKKVEEASAATELGDFLMLAYDPSPWKSEIHVSVTKDVPGGKMVKLSGTFFSKVFDGPYNARYRLQDGLRLRPVAERLSQLLRVSVPCTGDALGQGTEDAVRRLRPGEALLLENLRFHPEEEKNDPGFAKALAAYADVYVNDAFGTAHRAHASTYGVAELLPAYAGFLMEREIKYLTPLVEDPERPYAAIIGGAKVSDKIKVLDNLARKVDVLIVGGGMANTFLLAQGKAVGKSLAEPDRVEDARTIMAAAEERGVKLILPTDVIVAKEVTQGAEYKTLSADRVPASWHIVDVGRDSLQAMSAALEGARTIFWNGPLGVFEIPSFAAGTKAMAKLLAQKAEAGATVVVGGGDSVAAVTQQGLASKMSHISTGGGASLELIEGRTLPGIAIIPDRQPAGAGELS